MFLYRLYKEATDEEGNKDVLKGLQHVVLGYGASCYQTFQNAPRLTDKYLGECGSRRLAMRGELDEGGGDSDPLADLQKWEKAAFAALKNLPCPTTKEACPWTQPQEEIFEKDEDDLMMGMSL